MSTDATPTTLDDFQAEPEPEWRRTGEGALYGRASGVSASDVGTPQNTCLNCGRVVGPRVARVVGDNAGNVIACRECARTPHGTVYCSDVAAATAARLGDVGTVVVAADGGDGE